MNAFARVALFDLRLAGSYDYCVPDELQATLRVGHLVVVPIGHQTRTGVVTELPDASARANRPLLRLVYDEVLLPPELLVLGQWMADYYHCGFGKVLQTMLPPGVAVRGRKMVSWRGEPPAEEKYRALHDALRDGAQPREKLIELLGDGVLNTLRTLAKAGRVAIEEVIASPAVAPVHEELIVAAFPDEPLLSKREWQVARELAGAGLPLSRAEAVVLCKTTYDLLRKLEEKQGIVVKTSERERRRDFYSGYQPTRPAQLTEEQQAAVTAISEALQAGTYQTLLLHGVTGSGKTEVYLHAIAAALQLGGRALYLVPEIALTPQVIAQINHAFPDTVAVLHSALGQGERFDQWRRIARGEVTVVVGARSAVFAPLPALRLVIVDEEGEPAFKQQDAPYYHGRDVAILRAAKAGAVVVLGSAAPSLETWRNAQKGRYRLLRMRERIPGATLPRVTIVDMRAEFEQRRGYGMISEELVNALTITLGQQQQAIIFLNRRGYRSALICPACGEAVYCDKCSVPMTYHRQGANLLCHYCGATRAPLVRCPHCRKGLEYHGAGTQKIEEELSALFPQARIQRMDRDAITTTDALESVFARMQSREIDILMGTQMVAKGLDFPGVALVGVINADIAIHLPDFRAGERCFNQLLQVAGRSGRKNAGTVIIQTYNPDHPAVRFAATHDYAGFCEYELTQRQALGYPPLTRLALLTFSGKSEGAVAAAAQQLAGRMRRLKLPLTVKGPAPAALARIRERYRYQLLLLADKHATLAAALRAAGGTTAGAVTVDIDIDPISTM